MKTIKQKYAILDEDNCEIVTGWCASPKEAMQEFEAAPFIDDDNVYRLIAMNCTDTITIVQVVPEPVRETTFIEVNGKRWKK